MKDWLTRPPIVIVEGQGAVLWDENGRAYLDANSSIWTNLHGHRHPAINRAIRRQLGRIAHSSALGLANEPASLLAARLVELAASNQPGPDSAPLDKVFFSDDGSTAIEVALKLSAEFWRRQGLPKPLFLSLESAYHGDTVGAASVGQIGLFRRLGAPLQFRSERVMAPYCYRCPFNRAQPERADARQYRQCGWECVDQVENRFRRAQKRGRPITGMVVEPLVQGAAGMIAQPEGWLARVAPIVRAHHAHLIADEVMTGFGRVTGPRSPLFAMQDAGVAPDFLALAKGLTGGYLPMAATLTTPAVFSAFLGEHHEYKTFFHGHSYTGNQLGAAAALASLELLTRPGAAENRAQLAQQMSHELSALWARPQVGDIRQCGLVAGVELVRDWASRRPFEPAERAGPRVCAAMARRGVLTRPIGDVIVIMPPYCTRRKQLRTIVHALAESIDEALPLANRPTRV